VSKERRSREKGTQSNLDEGRTNVEGFEFRSKCNFVDGRRRVFVRSDFRPGVIVCGQKSNMRRAMEMSVNLLKVKNERQTNDVRMCRVRVQVRGTVKA
jgi:hypothetical protein